ncbi:putative short-chain dehydrogenase/reductase family protein [Annulohypoxylon bovei var. microspora]|nr:putative short-chain dehydrogenase/reductase family protein [Annulohypoxylon bovei var. microspora]
MDTTAFDISPEKEASVSQFLYRQFFVTPKAVLPGEVDLSSKTATVTGSNTGIGLECARQLLDLGLSKLIIAVRDESKGEVARKALAEAHKHSTIEVWKINLSSYDSVTEFAKRADTLDRLDIVVLNAGVWRGHEVFNESTGYEEDIQVNYMSTMLLAILILPTLKSKRVGTNPGRLILVSSDTAALAEFKERDAEPLLPTYKKKSDKPDMRVHPSVAIVNCANPGLCHGSSLQRDTKGAILKFLSNLAERIGGRSRSVGARVFVDAAVRHGGEVHGHYIEDCRIRPMAPIVYKPEGKRIAKFLWKELMTGELAFAKVEDIIQGLSE